MRCAQCNCHLDIVGIPAFTELPCPMCKAKLKVPARFASYFLLDKIGEGGMGAVYRALDPALDRVVALKVLLQSIAQDPVSLEAFQREAKAVARLNHPNVAHIYSLGVEKGQPFMAMEFIEGRSLGDLLDEHGALSEVTALRFGLHTALGLQAACDAGLVHADVKPQNIIIERDGRAKLIDFGLAVFGHGDTALSGIWGSPYYMAPERIRHEVLDLRADMYGLGAVLYHVLTGRVPHDGDDLAAICAAKLNEDVVPPSEYRNGLLPEVDGIVCRLLRRNQAERYPTYKSLISDLQKAVDLAAARPRNAVSAPKKDRVGHVENVIRKVRLLTARLTTGQVAPSSTDLRAAGQVKVRRRPNPSPRPGHGSVPAAGQPSGSRRQAPKGSSPVLAWGIAGLALAIVGVVAVIGLSEHGSDSKRQAHARVSDVGKAWEATGQRSMSERSQVSGSGERAAPSATVAATATPIATAAPVLLPKRSVRAFKESELALSARDDVVDTAADREVIAAVLRNDDWTGMVVPKLLSVTQPSNGVTKVVGQGVGYRPKDGFRGEDSFEYTVQYGSNRMSTAKVSVRVGIAAPEQMSNQTNDAVATAATGAGMGLTGEYYADTNFVSLKLVRVDPVVDLSLNGDAIPADTMSGDHFSVRWTGRLQPEFSELYTLYTDSDDGVRLWLNGQLLIDDWSAHGPRRSSATVAMAAGQKYDLRLDYFEGVGLATVRLLWSSASTPLQVVPTRCLIPGARGESGVLSAVVETNAAGVVSSVSDVGSSAAAGAASGASVQAVRAIGGIVRSYRQKGVNYTVHVFTNSGMLTVSSGGPVEYLVVGGGGGGGGGWQGGGGGGGGVLSGVTNLSASSYAVVVGAGGTGCNRVRGEVAGNGGNSSLGAVLAMGGGRGASELPNADAGVGGAGGGGAHSGGIAGGAGTPGQGFVGGNGLSEPSMNGGGGGGAGGVGVNAVGGGATAAGGPGLVVAIGGAPVLYSAGGCGRVREGSIVNGNSGAANTGNGGDAGSCLDSQGGNGGSGIVIVRYPAGGGVSK